MSCDESLTCRPVNHLFEDQLLDVCRPKCSQLPCDDYIYSTRRFT